MWLSAAFEGALGIDCKAAWTSHELERRGAIPGSNTTSHTNQSVPQGCVLLFVLLLSPGGFSGGNTSNHWGKGGTVKVR